MTTLLKDQPHWLEKITGEVADPRVRGWPTMDSPTWPLIISSVYLLMVYVWAPKFMKGRQAYSLTTYNNVYNVGQVLANSAMFYTVLTSGWTTTYSLIGCEPVDTSTSPVAMRMAKAFWWWYILKFVDLTETVVFVLRKKDRQVSFLHVYHHVSIFLVAWVACAFCPGGFLSFNILPNSFIHSIMYTYYLLSTIKNPSFQKKLSKVKKYITTMQMVQFTILTLHSSQAFLPGCKAPMFLMYYYVPNVIFLFYLFYKFYKSNYRSKTDKDN